MNGRWTYRGVVLLTGGLVTGYNANRCAGIDWALVPSARTATYVMGAIAVALIAAGLTCISKAIR